MFRWVLAFLLLWGSAQAATLQIVNGLGATDFMNGVRDSNNAFSARSALCDGTNPDTCAPVSATNGLTVSLSAASNLTTNLNQVNGVGIALGQTTMSASLPVTIASNQSALSVSVTANSAAAPKPAQLTIVALDVSSVSSGGTAVTALNSGHRTAGGWIHNLETETNVLCINEIGTASGTSSSGNTTCIQPGQTYSIAPAAGAVSVVSANGSHTFSGYGFQ